MAMSLETSECSGDAPLGIRVQSLALNVAGRPDPGATATGQPFGEVEAERAAAAENLGEAAPSQEGVA
jgi:hypothetical protein